MPSLVLLLTKEIVEMDENLSTYNILLAVQWHFQTILTIYL